MHRPQQLLRWMFARHSHPISAWSRLLTTPLVVVPFWTRRPAVTVGVLVWFAMNPIMTPEPSQRTSFATRAILGEERWMTGPGVDRTIIVLNTLSFATLNGAALAAWHRRKVPTVLGTVATMVLILWTWRRYADLYNRDRDAA